MARQRRASPLKDHPFWEEAQLLRDLARLAKSDTNGAFHQLRHALRPGESLGELAARLEYEARDLESMARGDTEYKP